MLVGWKRPRTHFSRAFVFSRRPSVFSSDVSCVESFTGFLSWLAVTIWICAWFYRIDRIEKRCSLIRIFKLFPVFSVVIPPGLNLKINVKIAPLCTLIVDSPAPRTLSVHLHYIIQKALTISFLHLTAAIWHSLLTHFFIGATPKQLRFISISIYHAGPLHQNRQYRR
jgi:hypothetical protein